MGATALNMTAHIWEKIAPKQRVLIFAMAATVCLFAIGGLEFGFFGGGPKPRHCERAKDIADIDEHIAALNAIIAANPKSDAAKEAWIYLVVAKNLREVVLEKC